MFWFPNKYADFHKRNDAHSARQISEFFCACSDFRTDGQIEFRLPNTFTCYIVTFRYTPSVVRSSSARKRQARRCAVDIVA